MKSTPDPLPIDRATARVHDVEAKSAGFRKELGLVDLALTQVLYVVGSLWVGTAAKLGDSHVVFWLLAITFYYLPQAAVVIYLNRRMPLEGGLYQWASVGLGRFVGFLVAWNLWAYTITIVGSFAVIIATNLSYLIAPDAASFTHARWYTPVVSGMTILAVTAMSILGLRTSKWLQNIGGAAQFLTYAALVVIPFVAVRRGLLASYDPLAASVPSVSLFSLNIFGKMALGALSGFEYVAILAGECRDPARTIGRSVVIAVPVIAAMFIFGTSSVLALVPNAQIDLVSPIPQTLIIGFQGLGVARLIVPLLIVLLLMRQVGTVTLIFAGNTRLPMVAGWDGLLPVWFTHLHPRFRTPVNSILIVGALTLAFTLAGQIGVGLQEAFQLIENVAGILYAFTYLGLFAIPLFAGGRLGERPPLWLRVASLAGFSVSLLYSTLSVFPIIDVPSWRLFSAKIITALAVMELVGVALYLRGRKAPLNVR